MTYPHNRSTVAAVRTSPERIRPSSSSPSARRRIDQQTFLEEFQFVVRQLYISTPTKSDAQRQLMKDVLKGRYAMRVIEQIADVAALSARPEHREAWVQFIRKYSLPNDGTPPCVVNARDAEDATNGPLNLAQTAFEREQTLSTKHAAKAAARAQLAETQSYLDAVEATPVYQ